MAIIGIILLLGGIGGAIYGNSLNNDGMAQLESFLSSGKTNPGDIYLYIGIGAAVLGLILLIAGIAKKKK